MAKKTSPYIYQLQVKTKEDVGGSSLGLQMGGRQCTWRYKSKCLVNKCLLGHIEKRHREEFSKLTVLGFFLSTMPSICSTIVS